MFLDVKRSSDYLKEHQKEYLFSEEHVVTRERMDLEWIDDGTMLDWMNKRAINSVYKLLLFWLVFSHEWARKLIFEWS